MKILLALLLIFAGCRSKYDTSKALDILPSDEITIDFRLKDIPFQIDEATQVATITSGTKIVAKIEKSTHDAQHFGDAIFTASNSKITALSLENPENKISKSHKITNPMLEIQKDFVLIFNAKGTFEVLKSGNKSGNLELAWSGRVGLSNEEFQREQKPKTLRERLNPKPEKQVFTLSSRFVCQEENCYAMTAEGIIAVLNVVKKQVQMAQIIAPQDITLHNTYKPIIANGNIVFATGNSEFIIFNIAKQAVIGQSSFANEDTASMFDINLVKAIYASNESVLISHLNGVYAFNIMQGTALWNKKLNIENAMISANYTVFFETKTQKLVCMNIQTGEAKWITALKSSPKVVEFINIARNNNAFNIIVGTQNGIEVLDFEDGTTQNFTKINLGNIKHSFIHNETFYYTNKNNIYKLK